MKFSSNHNINFWLNKIQLFSYLILGLTVFSLTSLADLNDFLRVYLVFFSAGVGFCLIYLILKKSSFLKKTKNC